MYVIIIGGGQIGSYMGELLLKNKCDFVIIDSDHNNIKKLSKKFNSENIIFGDGTDPNILSAARIEECDVVACVTGRDEVNLVCSVIAKFEFQCPRVVGRVNDPRNDWLYTIGMGVDAAINQADIIGNIVVEEMSMKSLMTLMKLSKGDHSIMQLIASEDCFASGKKIEDLNLPKSVLLIAIYHGDDFIVPNGKTVIYPGDRLTVFSSEKVIKEIEHIFTKKVN